MRALATAIAAAIIADGRGAAADDRDRDREAQMMADIRALVDPALAGRAAGGAGERAALDLATARLRALGLGVGEQPVPGGSANVYAIIPGRSAELIVLGAHVDHLGRRDGSLYPGADDNASGVALVLAVAADLAADRDQLDRSVAIVLFGAEEVGLRGSRELVRDPPAALPLAAIAAMVNVDMIARPLLDQRRLRAPLWLFGIDRDRATGLVGTRRYPGLRALADRAFADAGAGELVAAEDFTAAIDRAVTADAEGRSDSAPFERAGIPTLFFGDGESRDYHRPTDTIDKLAPAILVRRERAIARVVGELSRAPAEAFASRSPARDPVRRLPAPGVYALVGASTGVAIDRGGAGWLGGGELSAVDLAATSLRYAGGYVDLLADRGDHATRASIGGELGWGIAGLDAGFAGERAAGGAMAYGAVVRPFVSLGAIAISARLGYLRAAGGDGHAWLGELALAIKLPLHL